jgi:hypothetical protein
MLVEVFSKKDSFLLPNPSEDSLDFLAFSYYDFNDSSIKAEGSRKLVVIWKH